MSTYTAIPTPAPASDRLTVSVGLRQRLEQVLADVVAQTPLLFVELACPPLLDGPVTAERPAAEESEDRSLLFRQLALPATKRSPGGTLLLATREQQALHQAGALPALLATIVELELARVEAEGLAVDAVEMANRDAATGLGNRRAWLQTLRTESARVARTHRPLSLVILDIDGLKAVNDNEGHAAGDRLIAATGAVLSQARRATDVVCRLGGDEFGIAAPDTDESQAGRLCERVRELLRAQDIAVSLGHATSNAAPGSSPGADTLWQQADTTMYEDKRARQLP